MNGFQPIKCDINHCQCWKLLNKILSMNMKEFFNAFLFQSRSLYNKKTEANACKWKQQYYMLNLFEEKILSVQCNLSSLSAQ